MEREYKLKVTWGKTEGLWSGEGFSKTHSGVLLTENEALIIKKDYESRKGLDNPVELLHRGPQEAPAPNEFDICKGRNALAAMVLQGFLSNPEVADTDRVELIDGSIEIADDLIKQLG